MTRLKRKPSATTVARWVTGVENAVLPKLRQWNSSHSPRDSQQQQCWKEWRTTPCIHVQKWASNIGWVLYLDFWFRGGSAHDGEKRLDWYLRGIWDSTKSFSHRQWGSFSIGSWMCQVGSTTLQPVRGMHIAGCAQYPGGRQSIFWGCCSRKRIRHYSRQSKCSLLLGFQTDRPRCSVWCWAVFYIPTPLTTQPSLKCSKEC